MPCPPAPQTNNAEFRSTGLSTRAQPNGTGCKPVLRAEVCMEALMIGVSGLRGTVGGTLTPQVVSRMAAAFAVWLKHSGAPANGRHFRIVIGRDSRPSGLWVRDAAAAA